MARPDYAIRDHRLVGCRNSAGDIAVFRGTPILKRDRTHNNLLLVEADETRAQALRINHDVGRIAGRAAKLDVLIRAGNRQGR